MWLKTYEFMNRAVSVSELMKTNHRAIEFKGQWKNSIGRPEKTGSWIIWGNSGNGKTRFALQLAKYLCNFGRVAYNSLEEGASLSMKKAFIETGMEAVKTKIILLDKEPIPELIARLEKKKSPDFIFLDSAQYSGMNYKQYQLLIERFRNKLFILISHADGKQPAGRVAKSIRFDSFVKIWVEGYRAFPTSRYADGKAEPYTIWEKGAFEYWGTN